MEFGFSLPGRGPLASIDVVLTLADSSDAFAKETDERITDGVARLARVFA